MRILTAEFCAGHADLPNQFTHADQDFLGDNWSLGGTGLDVTQNAVGLNGKADSAYTFDKTSTTGLPFFRSLDRFCEPGEVVTGRVFIRKESTSPAQWGVRIVADANVAVDVRGSYSTTSVSTSGSVATYYGYDKQLREIAGQEWWEVTLWFENTANYEEVELRVYPNIDSAATTLTGIFTHPCLYRSTGFTPASESPWTTPESVIQGTPPDHGLIAVSSAAIPATGVPGVSGKTLEGMASKLYEPRMLDASNLEYTVSWPVWGRGRSQRSFGGFSISNQDGQYDYLRDYDLRDCIVKVRLWDDSSDVFLPDLGMQVDEGYANTPASQVYVGVVESVRFSGKDEIRITLADRQSKIYEPLGGIFDLQSPDIYPQASGETRPLTIGRPMQVTPVLVDQSTNEYICHQGTLDSISEVYIDGVPQSTVSPTWAYNGDTTGFTLPAEATGTVTCDPASDFTGNLLDVASNLEVYVGSDFSYDFVSWTDLSDLEFNLQTYQYGFYLKEQSAAWVLDGVAQSLGAFWFANSQGRVVIRRMVDPSSSNYLQNWMLNADYTREMDRFRVIENSVSAASYAYVYPNKKSVDGSYSAYYPYDDSATNIQSARTGGSAGTQLVLPAPTSHNTMVMRALVKKDTSVTYDTEFRAFDASGASTEMSFTINQKTGVVANYSSAGGSVTSNQWRDADGGIWWEGVCEIPTTSGQSYEVRLYPAGTSAAQTGGTVLTNLELYYDLTKDDIVGTPLAQHHERWIRYEELLQEPIIEVDDAPGLSTQMYAKKNWTVASANSANSSDINAFTKPAQITVETTEILARMYQEAAQRTPIMSMFTGDEALGIAQTCIDDICGLYSKNRQFVTLTIPLDNRKISSLIDDMGTVWRLELVTGGAIFSYGMLCGCKYNSKNDTMTLRFWQ